MKGKRAKERIREGKKTKVRRSGVIPRDEYDVNK